MTAKEALDKLDKTVIGDLEWKIAITNALEKQIKLEEVVARLEEIQGTCNGHKCGKDGCAGCVDCKIENAYADAIEIVKEGMG